MSAALYDAAVVEHDYYVGILYRGEAVCDDEHGAALHEGVHAALDYCLRSGIYRGSGLVEDHYGRVGDRHARYREQLALALRKAGAVAGDEGVVTLRAGG